MAVTGTYLLSRVFGGGKSIGSRAGCGTVDWIHRAMTVICAVSLALGFIVLPGTQSRAAWLALVLTLGIRAALLSDAFKKVKNHRWMGIAAAAAVIVLCIMVFQFKAQSARGRLHIWKMELLALKECPVRGTGEGTVLGVYGRTQERFFREDEGRIEKELEMQVAGSPQFAFNEYLKIGIERGFPVMFVFISALIVIIIAGWRDSVFTPGLAAWAVFAFFSYPFSIRSFCVMLLILIFGIILENDWTKSGKSITLLISCAVVVCVTVCHIDVKDAFRLYSSYFSSARHYRECGWYEESDSLLKLGCAISADPMFHVMLGRNAEDRGDYGEAFRQYDTAHYMIPSRLYPLMRTMRLYHKNGMTVRAKNLGDYILNMPVNPRNMAMVNLHEECRMLTDSLSNILRNETSVRKQDY